MSKPQLLVFGSTGQVAMELKAHAYIAGFELIVLGRSEVDLNDIHAVSHAIERAPDGVVGVVNAAAYTAVDAAETDENAAYAINAEAPGVMAAASAARAIDFVHISTDYVFDGTKSGPYTTDDPVAPMGVYGRSKLAGEDAVLAAKPDAIILRTAWVYSRHRGNFLKTMLRLAETRDELGIVGDQTGCPTPAGGIARAIFSILQQRCHGEGLATGVFHYCGDEAVSWKVFADAIFAASARAGGKRPVVRAITTAEYPTPAARPANSALDCSRIHAAYGISPADWRASVEEDVQSLLTDKIEGDTP